MIYIAIEIQSNFSFATRYQKYFVEKLLNRLISLPTLWFNISFLAADNNASFVLV